MHHNRILVALQQ